MVDSGLTRDADLLRPCGAGLHHRHVTVLIVHVLEMVDVQNHEGVP